MAQLHKLDFTTSSAVPIALSDGSNFFSASLAKLKFHDSKLKSRVVVGNTPQTISATSRLIGLSMSQDSKTCLISPMAVRRNISNSLYQLQHLWRFVLLYANIIPPPRQDVSPLILEFLQALQAVARQIVSFRPKMSFVQRYCLLWTVCVEDCLKMLATSNSFLSQNLINSITDLMLVSAREIPEMVVVVNEQLGPLLQNQDIDKSGGLSPSGAHQVRNALIFVLLYLTDQSEVGPGRFALQSQQLALPFQITKPTTT
jgi:hypothetical protein